MDKYCNCDTNTYWVHGECHCVNCQLPKTIKYNTKEMFEVVGRWLNTEIEIESIAESKAESFRKYVLDKRLKNETP